MNRFRCRLLDASFCQIPNYLMMTLKKIFGRLNLLKLLASHYWRTKNIKNCDRGSFIHCDLCINHDRCMNIFNIVEGADVIISIMYYHRNDSNIQEAWAQSLSNFATNDRIKTWCWRNRRCLILGPVRSNTVKIWLKYLMILSLRDNCLHLFYE